MNIYVYSLCDAFLKTQHYNYYLTKSNPIILTEFDKNQLLEIIPKSDFEPSYFLNADKHYHKNMRLIDLYDGFLLIPKLTRLRNHPRSTVFSKNQYYYGREFNVSVVTDGGIKLILSGDYYHQELELYFKPDNIKLIPLETAPLLFIILEKWKKHIICIKLPELKILFNSVCDDYKIDQNLTTTTVYDDIAKHKAQDLWQINDPFTLTGRSLTFEKNDYNNDVLPYAFLQEIALCGDYSRFLNDSLREKSNLIPSFFGKFDYILPPFLKHCENKIALVSDESIKFVSFSIMQGKICDISIDD